MNWFTGAARDGGLIAAMSEPLEWTERSENEHPTDRDMAHYVVYKRSDGKWGSWIRVQASG